ncbi:hypothetical protein ACFSTC_29600 [Nonomuraea ferruginea]
MSSPDVPLAHLIAGRLALALGRTAVARTHLAAAARGRRHGPALSRAVAWLAEALRAEAEHDPARLMRACRRGLDVLDQHRATLGSSELRAQASAHGAELAALGQRHALRLDRPRLLLAWSERWRATALAVPSVRPPDDERLQADLAAIRAVTDRLAQARAQGLPTAHLAAEQLRLERAARSRALHAPGQDADATTGCDVPALLAELGGDRLLELVDVDGLGCTCWSAAPARCAASPRGTPRRPRATSTSPASACPGWRTADPRSARPTCSPRWRRAAARCRRRCSATPRTTSATARW